MKAQDRVAEAVAARGYRHSWTREQFIARNVAKLAEELGELRDYVYQERFHSLAWEDRLAEAAFGAKLEFDDGCWNGACVTDLEGAREELADVQVVVFNIADALEFDVVEAAVEKAERDVARGIRGSDGDD